MKMDRATRFQLRLQSSTTGLILALILVLIAYASHRWSVRWDWTAGGRHTLAEQSIQAVGAFPDGVTATAYVQERGDMRREIEALLEKYRAVNGDLTIRYVDPDLDPAAARREDIALYGTVVLRSGQRSEKITEATEQALTNGFIRLAKGDAKILRVIQGHGERPLAAPAAGMGGETGAARVSLSRAVLLLKGEGYGVEPLSLAEVEAVPEKTAAILLPGPRTPLLPIEVQRLKKWVGEGGRLLLMHDPGGRTGLEPMLAEWGLHFLDGLVIDPVARLFGGGPTTPLVSRYDEHHPVTKGLGSPSFFPEARALELKPVPADATRTRVELLSGADRGWLETGSIESGEVEMNEGSDRPGPLLLGVAVERGKTRLLVVGDSDFATDAYVGFSGNVDLFLNMVRWLAEDENFIAIKPKEVLDADLSMTQGQGILLFWGLTLIIPVFLLSMGLIIWSRRKRR